MFLGQLAPNFVLDLLGLSLDRLGLFWQLYLFLWGLLDSWLVVEPVIIVGLNLPIGKSGLGLLFFWWSFVIGVFYFKTLSYTGSLSGFVSQ